MAEIRPLNKALLDTDIESEILKAVNPTVTANALAYRLAGLAAAPPIPREGTGQNSGIAAVPRRFPRTRPGRPAMSHGRRSIDIPR